MPFRTPQSTPDGPNAADTGGRRATRGAVPDGRTAVPSSAAEVLALQRQVGNRAVARLLGLTEPGPETDTRPDMAVRPAGPPGAAAGSRADAGPERAPVDHIARSASSAIQREIQIKGTAANLTELFAQAKDIKERIILANWHWSDTVHNFTPSKGKSAEQKVFLAVARVKGALADVPPLFAAANLRFLTMDTDRLPTLYFVSGGLSGRIRQQHGSGPSVFTETGKFDYFFPTKEEMQAFRATAKRLKTKTKIDAYLAKTTGTTTPTDGWAHLEMPFSGGVLQKGTHPSGGLVSTNIGDYDDVKIGAIYQSVIGAAL